MKAVVLIQYVVTGKGDQTDSGDYVSGKKLRQSPQRKRSVGKARSAVLEVSTLLMLLDHSRPFKSI